MSAAQLLKRANTPRDIAAAVATMLPLSELRTPAGFHDGVERIVRNAAVRNASVENLHLWALALGTVQVGNTSHDQSAYRFARAAVGYLTRAHTPDDELLHRHADGTEHAHAGSWGFLIGGQVRTDDLGDDQHSHGSISLTVEAYDPATAADQLATRPTTGPVVWTARHGDLETRP